MKRIAIIGECMIELNGEPFGSMQQTFGGDTLNAAVYLNRSLQNSQFKTNDIEVNYVTALGQDPISKGMLTRWQDEGIKTDLVLEDQHRTPGLYLIQLDSEGERTFLYWRNQSPARYLLQHPKFEDIVNQLINMDMVFISGISLAILPDADRIKLLALLERLRSHNVEIAFDSNFRPALWPQDDHDFTVKSIYKTMYSHTDLALVTFDDEQLLWGDASPEVTLARLQKLGVQKAVVKLGAEGCLVQDFTHQDNAQLIATTPVKKVIDTTSAGDSFNGGFLAYYLNDSTLEISCQRGNMLAGLVIQHRGAIINKEITNTVTQL
ncbi:sugar kinase [Vibrio sp. SS-MA-C1-2]|uniref:sugar kinase n=1 Tax=Vibrio sp. SS-MA-C1-2 TaxID=2908646 RepID=UPI001F41AA8C|nr:sugar kinase [Vibrio sp. SS-MA-C1-2]UJF18265.1 sugar kinase [Vibrio sp. SS-MA-C1-2]